MLFLVITCFLLYCFVDFLLLSSGLLYAFLFSLALKRAEPIMFFETSVTAMHKFWQFWQFPKRIQCLNFAIKLGKNFMYGLTFMALMFLEVLDDLGSGTFFLHRQLIDALSRSFEEALNNKADFSGNPIVCHVPCLNITCYHQVEHKKTLALIFQDICEGNPVSCCIRLLFQCKLVKSKRQKLFPELVDVMTRLIGGSDNLAFSEQLNSVLREKDEWAESLLIQMHIIESISAFHRQSPLKTLSTPEQPKQPLKTMTKEQLDKVNRTIVPCRKLCQTWLDIKGDDHYRWTILSECYK